MLDTASEHCPFKCDRGEKLNAFSVRSSLANKLGVVKRRPFPTTGKTDGLAEIMLDAVQNLTEPLALDRVCIGTIGCFLKRLHHV